MAPTLYESADQLQTFVDTAKALAADIRELKIGADTRSIDIELIHKEAELRALVSRDYHGAMTSLMNIFQGAMNS